MSDISTPNSIRLALLRLRRKAEQRRTRKLASDPARQFKDDVNSALRILKDAVDTASARGSGYDFEGRTSLADDDGQVATTVQVIRDFSGKISRPLSHIR